MMKTAIIIPARLASSRLPRKMLIEIQGKPLIQWTYEAAVRAKVDHILVAVDDPELLECVEGFGAPVVMTAFHHPTGTDRVIEAMQHLGLGDQDIVVNVQGDEPLIPVDNIMQVIEGLKAKPEAVCATLCEQIECLEDVLNPNIVKVVRDHQGFALYFSRASIPWVRASFPRNYPAQHPCDRHLGLYAYRVQFLKMYSQLGLAPIENLEALEQLRILYHGFRIYVAQASSPSGIGIDTAEDVDRLNRALGLR